MDKIDRIIAEYQKNVIENEKQEEKLAATKKEIEDRRESVSVFFNDTNVTLNYNKEELEYYGMYEDAQFYYDATEKISQSFRAVDEALKDEQEKVTAELKKVSHQRDDLDKKYRQDMSDAEGA
ncbi:MAG: hypothetical protein FWD05_09450 [Oscillospiraceae bacterium]|nr:hypothetical protein [Oscillospiraceae bacterium]